MMIQVKYEILQKGLLSHVIEKETAGHKKIFFPRWPPEILKTWSLLTCQKFELIKTWYKIILKVKFENVINVLSVDKQMQISK